MTRPNMQIIEEWNGDWISDSSNGGHYDGKVARLNREPHTREDFALLEEHGITNWECASYGAGGYDGYYRVLTGALNEYQYDYDTYMRIAKANNIDKRFAQNFWDDVMARVASGNNTLAAAAAAEMFGGVSGKNRAYRDTKRTLWLYSVLAVLGVVIGACYPLVYVFPQVLDYGLGLIDCIEVFGLYICGR